MCPQGQLWVDVDAFEEAAETARRSEDPAAYRTAIELYSGELLPEDRYEEWAESRRQELGRTLFFLSSSLGFTRSAGRGFGTCRPGSSEGAGRGAHQRGGARGAYAPVRLLRAIGRSPEAVRQALRSALQRVRRRAERLHPRPKRGDRGRKARRTLPGSLPSPLENRRERPQEGEYRRTIFPPRGPAS